MRGVELTVPLVALAGLVAFGCGSRDIESYDGAYRQHEWGAVDYDATYTATTASHAVHLRATVARRNASGRIVMVEVNCSGTLIGPDRVLTAAHCVRDLSTTLDLEGCPSTELGDNGFEVLFDDQYELDSLVRRSTVAARATSFETEALSPAMTPAGLVCAVDENSDVATVIITPAIGLQRGWERITASPPTANQLQPIIHHPAGDPKKIVVGRVLGPEAGRTRIALFITPTVTSALPPSSPLRDRGLEGGSSGSALLDTNGYIQGVFNEDGTTGTARCLEGGSLIHCNLFVPVTDVASSLSLPLRAETNRMLIASLDAAGALDPSFTSHGTDFPGRREQANAIAMRPDGRFVTVGYATVTEGSREIALAGYQLDGTEDPTFGALGRQVVTLASSATEQLDDVAIQVASGQTFIVATGRVSEPDGIAVTRFSLGGSPDLTFGGGSPDVAEAGVLVRAVRGQDERAVAIAVAPSSGAIVSAGTTWLNTLGIKGRPVVVRFNADGTRDTTCGNDGLFVWDPLWPVVLDGNVTDEENKQGSGDIVVTDMALTPDEDIVMVGYAHFYGARRYLWAGRLHGADCTPDTSFGSDGSGNVTLDARLVSGPSAGHIWAEAVTVDSLGRILVAGAVSSFDVTRGMYAANMLFMALDDNGEVKALGGSTSGDRWHEVAHDIAVRSDGRIVLAGRSYRHIDDDDVNRMVVAVLTPTGSPVSRWTPNLSGSTDEWATSLALDAADRPIVTGLSREAD